MFFPYIGKSFVRDLLNNCQIFSYICKKKKRNKPAVLKKPIA